MLIARLIDLIRNDLICVPVRLCACAPHYYYFPRDY
jgi:hypothetical protein